MTQILTCTTPEERWETPSTSQETFCENITFQSGQTDVSKNLRGGGGGGCNKVFDVCFVYYCYKSTGWLCEILRCYITWTTGHYVM